MPPVQCVTDVPVHSLRPEGNNSLALRERVDGSHHFFNCHEPVHDYVELLVGLVAVFTHQEAVAVRAHRPVKGVNIAEVPVPQFLQHKQGFRDARFKAGVARQTTAN